MRKLSCRLNPTALLVLTMAVAGCGDDHGDLQNPVPSKTGGHDGGAAGQGGSAGASCKSSADCVGFVDEPICDPVTSTCVACLTTPDCAADRECLDQRCAPIARCASSLDCPVGKVCDPSTERCVECDADADCGDGRCVGQTCRTACDSDNDCTPQGQLCDKASGYCVECFDHTACASYEHCSLGFCKQDVCSQGAASCDGDSIVTCNDAGSGFDAPIPCGAQQSCKAVGGAASCEAWTCTPEVVFCTATELVAKCGADGLSQTVTDDCGAAGEVCVAGACAEVVCTPGERFCNGDVVVQCSAKGDSSTVYATCTVAQYCDEGTASCLAKVCVPGGPVCSGNTATACNAQGSGVLPGGIDCSSSGLWCSQGECRAQVCDPNSEYCDAGSVRRCAPDGLSSIIVQTCGATQYCNASTASCAPQICAPSTPVCDNVVATTCNAEGSGYAPGGVDCAAAGHVCFEGGCFDMVCIPDSYFCQNGNVHLCSSDGLSSIIHSICGAGEYCSDVSTLCEEHVCMPAHPACDGNTATMCNAQGSGFEAGGVPCGVQHCFDGACIDGLFVEDFEDGDYVGWSAISTDTTQTISSAVAANGTLRSLLVEKLSGTLQSHNEGLMRTVPALQPQRISWWSRASQTGKSSTYFTLYSSTTTYDRLVSVYFRSTGLIRLSIDTTTSYEVPYVVDQWYHLELRNMNWSTRTFDYYIDDVLVQAGVPILGTGASVGRIDLYHYDAATAGYWDEIEFQ